MRLPTRSALVRLARIDAAIRAGECPNVTTLARQLEVNPRTVQRDLDYFRDQLGAPSPTTPSAAATATRSSPGRCAQRLTASLILALDPA
jgi:predicted DNA-binding transcriptional regulator YafY